jgi:hemolysin activation/secretion protein
VRVSPRQKLKALSARRVFALLALLVFNDLACAQDFERIAPKQPPPAAPRKAPKQPEPAPSAADTTVLVAELKGIVLVPDQSRVDPSGASGVRGVETRGVDLPDRSAFEKIGSRYIGHALSLATLNALTRDVIKFYRDHDRPIVDVVVPEQDITAGVVQLIVVEGRLGQVRAEGNKWFRGSLLESQVRTRPGEAIRASRMLADLNWLNGNPFREVSLLYTPGKSASTTDVILQTKDRFPLRIYSGYEDSGNPPLGRERWLAGFNWGNAFWADHQLSYQFTTSSDLESLRAHSLTYTAPLPWRHTLTLFGAYTETSAVIARDTALFHSGGASEEAGIRYTIPLPALGPLAHDLAAGFDFKRTNNNLEFGGDQVFDTNTDILEWSLGYDASAKDPLGATSLNASVFYGPGNLTGGNTDVAFQQARAFARSDYVYMRVSAERANRLPKNFSLMLRGTWQWSDANLLASEQLGVGGYNTVRGYDEREARGDSGWLLSAELRAPPVGPGGLLHVSKLNDQLQLLGFWDYGVAQIHRPLPDEKRSIELASAGAGFRYTINSNLSLRFDYAWQLIDSGDRFGSRAHMGVLVSY